ncbi:DUF4038 domain-containing protein [Methylomarinovum tepidoasis]|nr:DUF4038 domain-containing protein [Methylomarinovum sp. IN45]
MLFFLLVIIADAEARTAIQWHPTELQFEANRSLPHPLGVKFGAVFRGPEQSRLTVPGFWDGGRTFKIRFAPPSAGIWTYRTYASEASLKGKEGTFKVEASHSTNPLFRHGGFLQVSANRRYLTFTDGTPFFWLGDTWWFCPGRRCPLNRSSNPKIGSMYKHMVDVRAKQGYTTALMLFAGHSPTFLYPDQWNASYLRNWYLVDSYISYANQKGLIPVLGTGFHKALDKVPLSQLKLLWRYLIARYSAYAVGWLIVGEYNFQNDSRRIAKVDELGEYIKKLDPYKRALSVHPWLYTKEKHQLWDRPWYDFIMIQGGHGYPPPIKYYLSIFNRSPAKPFLETEARYEGIFNAGPDDVRHAAYRAIQAGSFGYTYGSHGLWLPLLYPGEKIPSLEAWGKALPWWQALKRPGAEQMGHLRRFYEALPWWNMAPRPKQVIDNIGDDDKRRVLLKGDDDRWWAIYFPRYLDANHVVRLQRMPQGVYTGKWFDPRRGVFTSLPKAFSPTSGGYLTLPARPAGSDWLLVLEKVR